MEEASNEQVIIEERITKVNGDFHIKRYLRGKFLGKGGFAKVYIFTNLETNKPLAGKVMPKANLNRSRARQKLMTEIRLHKSLHHANIVKFEHVFEDQENVYILLELCQNQSMNELLKRRKRLTEFEVQCYVIQTIEALKYLHSNRIIHRDLKLGNMFLNDKMQVKLGDFGLAAKLEFDGEKKRTVCGTPNYIAPEILDGNIGHSYQVDVWSLGVIVYILTIGKPPFETTDIKLTYKKIKACEYSFPDNASISENAKDLISKILVIEPEKRLTLDEILLHPFINHGGPIPQLMPVSTLACPPTPNYIKQFAATSTSQRIRIATEPEGLDTLDLMKSPKGLYSNTARGPTFLKSPTGGDGAPFDFFRATPKTPKIDFFAPDKYGTLGTLGTLPTLGSEKTRIPTLMSPTSPKIKSLASTEGPEEIQEKSTKTQVLNNKEHIPNQSKTIPSSEIRVIKFYDYSTKYGLGYALSNGAVGVFFNDGSKFISDSELTFKYIVRRPSDKQDVATTYNFKDYPEDVRKRVLVYNRFKEYFENVLKNTTKQEANVYVKKWIKTKHAVFFRMNNQVLQVTFNDHTILIMNTNTKKLTFIDSKENTYICNLENATSSENKDLVKRLKYTEEVLKHMGTPQTNGTSPQKDQILPQKDQSQNKEDQNLEKPQETFSVIATN